MRVRDPRRLSAGLQFLPGGADPFVDPRQNSNAVLFLASDEARDITGIQLRVDAGSLLKHPNGPSRLSSNAVG